MTKFSVKNVNHDVIIDTLCGTRFGNSVVTVLPVQNKNFSANTKELAKVLGADQEIKSHLY